jgi:sec-independent protein translocase protein TatA
MSILIKTEIKKEGRLNLACVSAAYDYNFSMFGIGTQELLLVLLIVLVLFGSSKLPQLARGIGQFIKELRKGLKDTDDKETPPETKQ